MTDKQELKPCPFCGAGAEFGHAAGIPLAGDCTAIRCSNDQCITRGAYNDWGHRRAAIAAWNTRTQEEGR